MIISVNTLLSSIGKSEKAEKIINFCHGLIWVKVIYEGTGVDTEQESCFLYAHTFLFDLFNSILYCFS